MHPIGICGIAIKRAGNQSRLLTSAQLKQIQSFISHHAVKFVRLVSSPQTFFQMNLERVFVFGDDLSQLFEFGSCALDLNDNKTWNLWPRIFHRFSNRTQHIACVYVNVKCVPQPNGHLIFGECASAHTSCAIHSGALFGAPSTQSEFWYPFAHTYWQSLFVYKNIMHADWSLNRSVLKQIQCATETYCSRRFDIWTNNLWWASDSVTNSSCNCLFSITVPSNSLSHSLRIRSVMLTTYFWCTQPKPCAQKRTIPIQIDGWTHAPTCKPLSHVKNVKLLVMKSCLFQNF